MLTAWIPVDDSQDDLRDFAWRYQWTRLHQNAAVTVLDTNGATLSSHGNLLTADANGITEWDAAGAAPTLRWSGDASDVTLSPNGRWAAITSGEITNLIDISCGNTALQMPHDRCAFSSNSKFIVAWTANAEIESIASERDAFPVLTLGTETPQPTESLDVSGFSGLPDVADRLQLADDGRSFLLRGTHPSKDFTKYYQAAAILAEQPGPVSWDHRNRVTSCAISPSRRIIASGSGTGIVHLRLRSDLTNKVAISTHLGSVTTLRFSFDGTKLAAGGSNGSIHVWDVSTLDDLTKLAEPQAHTPRLLRTIKAHVHVVRSLTFSPDGSKLASFDDDGVSKLWNWQTVARRYEVKEFGSRSLDGSTALEFENRNGGVAVKEVMPQHEVVRRSISTRLNQNS